MEIFIKKYYENCVNIKNFTNIKSIFVAVLYMFSDNRK